MNLDLNIVGPSGSRFCQRCCFKAVLGGLDS